MGTIAPTWPSDGDTIDAADISVPGNIIVTAINGNLDSNNISAGGVTPANLASGTGSSWAWQSYTPSWTAVSVNPAIGDGTITGKYIQTGKTVKVRIHIVAGSTTTFGNGLYNFSIPVTAVSFSAANGYSAASTVGTGSFTDTSAGFYVPGYVVMQTTTTVRLYTPQTFGGSNPQFALGVSAGSTTAGLTPATTDVFTLAFEYEAA